MSSVTPLTVWQSGAHARVRTERVLDDGGDDARGALARSLRANPYEFFDATWLRSVVRQVVRHSNKRSRATAAKRDGVPRVSVLMNLRLRVAAHAERWAEHESAVVLESGQMLAACGADDEQKAALVTLILRPTDEALLARQLRWRILPLGAAPRFAVRAELLPSAGMGVDDDDQGEAYQIIAQQHGEHGTRVANALRAQPTMAAMLARELAARPQSESAVRACESDGDESGSSGSSGSSRSFGSDEAEEVSESEAEREAGSASSEPEGISLGSSSDDEDDEDDDDDEDDESSESSSASAESSRAAESGSVSEEGGVRARVLGMLASSDDEADSVREDSLSGDASDARAQSPSVAPRDTRFDTLEWLHVLVQQRSFTLGFELTHQSPQARYCEHLRRFEVRASALPQALAQHLVLRASADASEARESDETLFLYVGRAAQLRQRARGKRLLRRAARVQRTAPSAPSAPVVLQSTNAVVDALVDTVCAAQDDAAGEPEPAAPESLLDQLAVVDLTQLTLYELEVYGRARLEAMLALQRGIDGARRYPQQSGAVRSTLCALRGAAEREIVHEAIGLLCLLLVAAHNQRLLDNLYALETLWFDQTAHIDELDRAEQGDELQQHLSTIEATHRALPDQFVTDNDALLALVRALGQEWCEALDESCAE